MAGTGGDGGQRHLSLRGTGRWHGFAACTALMFQFFTAALAQEFTPNVSSLGSLTCQQLWYLEQETLADGRVCLKSARARQAFRKAKPCISNEERILPAKVRGYLAAVRNTARAKSCSEF